MNKLFLGTVLILSVFLMGSCKKNKNRTSVNPGKTSNATGLDFATKDGQEGFEVKSFKGQPVGPNLVFIEGGRFTMGTVEEDVTFSRDNLERTVTVASFYMDETEMANINWLEYLHDVQQDSTREYYTSALPDTTVWTRNMSFNDQYVDQYLRYPGFRYYPVVGVSWLQAIDYSKWRTRVVNDDLSKDPSKSGMFSKLGKKKKGEAEAEVDGGGPEGISVDKPGRLAIESGKVLPGYRLPTEAEWEYAAKAMIGTQYIDENQSTQRVYPWDGSSLRDPKGRDRGRMLANFKRGRGDYAGIAGNLNDESIITAEVYSFEPNDFGLYNMAGNVNEWVYDLYRPNSFQDMNDLNPIRRNDYEDEDSLYDTENYNSLIDNSIRVYKGGSWNDVAYWLAPGTRRYFAQDSSTSTIGFRCAMIAVGSKGGK